MTNQEAKAARNYLNALSKDLQDAEARKDSNAVRAIKKEIRATEIALTES